MKTRIDFVSNSSSCSFVLAVGNEYAAKGFVKDISKLCAKERGEPLNKKLATHNQRVLDFYLNEYELIFLGALEFPRKENVFTEESVLKDQLDQLDDVKDDVSDEDIAEIKEYAKHCWERIYNDVKNPTKWHKKNYPDDYVVEKDGVPEVHTFYPNVVEGYAVSTLDELWSMIHSRKWSEREGKKEKTEDIKRRIGGIVRDAKKHGEDYYSRDVCCYNITKDTIATTRELKKYAKDFGAKLVLEDWENLDKLEKLIDDGNLLYRIRIAHSGDGWSSYYIYTSDEIPLLEDNLVGCEVISCETM